MSKKSIATIFSLPLVSLVLGIYSQSCFALSLCWLVLGLGSVIFVLVLFSWFRCTQYISFFMALIFFLTGGVLSVLQKKQFEVLLNRYAQQPLRMIASVQSVESHEGKNYRQTLLLHVEKVMKIGSQEQDGSQKYQAADFFVLCYAREKMHYLVADKLELSPVTIKTAQTTTLSGNPAFADYLIKENILAVIFLNKKNNITLLERPKNSLSRWLWQKTEKLWHEVKMKLSPLASRYYSLLFLGNKSYGDLTELRERFNLWGLAHYLARSGLHIIIFIMIWRYLLSFFPLHIFLKKIILILLCIIYHLLSWPSISFLRAYYVFLFLQTGTLLHQQTNFFHLLTLICLLILLFNPMQLFFLDFQLSFGLTFALAWQSHL